MISAATPPSAARSQSDQGVASAKNRPSVWKVSQIAVVAMTDPNSRDQRSE